MDLHIALSRHQSIFGIKAINVHIGFNLKTLNKGPGIECQRWDIEKLIAITKWTIHRMINTRLFVLIARSLRTYHRWSYANIRPLVVKKHVDLVYAKANTPWLRERFLISGSRHYATLI
jgi:hypothetical protein